MATKTIYNDARSINLQPIEAGRTVSTDSELTARAKLLARQGEVLFEQIVPQLNRLQPGRVRTEEEFRQVCLALALFVHHLLASDSDDIESDVAVKQRQEGSDEEPQGRGIA